MADEGRTLTLFGKDYSQVPCFRNSFLYGISSGIGSGLLYFMFTSKVRNASNFGVGIYAAVVLGYWSYCRYNYSVVKFETAKVQAALEKQALFDTEAGGKFDA